MKMRSGNLDARQMCGYPASFGHFAGADAAVNSGRSGHAGGLVSFTKFLFFATEWPHYNTQYDVKAAVSKKAMNLSYP